MTSTGYAPAAVHQKRASVSSTATSNGTPNKPDAALRAATLSFSPPITRKSSDEVSVSPSRTNGTALIAARAIGAVTPSPRPLAANSPDKPTVLSRQNSTADGYAHQTTASPSSLYSPLSNSGSLKAAQLSVSRKSSAASLDLSRGNRTDDPNALKFSNNYNHQQSDDVAIRTPVEGSLIAAKLSAQKKGTKPLPPAKDLMSFRNDSQPSLLAASLAASRSVTPNNMPNTQPERDQEPDILPPAGSVSEAKKRLLQQADEVPADSPIRGRRSQDSPLRSKPSGTFSDPPPQSTANISPLSAAKLAVQHSGRSAGASSTGSLKPSSKPRQPSPIKKELKRDFTPTDAPISPPPKPIALKKPAFQNIKITETPIIPPPISPKPAKPIVKKVVAQGTGDVKPPPQPIKPLPRKTRPPSRAPRSVVPDTSPSPTLDSISSLKESERTHSQASRSDSDLPKIAPPLPLPRGTKAAVDSPRLVESVKLDPPVINVKQIDPVKQTPPVAKLRPIEKPISIDPVKPEPPVVKPKPVEPAKKEIPVVKPKPEPPKPKAFVDSIVNRQPASIYQNKNPSTATLPAVLPPPSGTEWRRRSTSGIQKLRQNHTGPDSTRPVPRPSASWRDDLPYNFYQTDDFIRPSHTGDSLRHALAASSLASSRAGSPVKSNPLPLPPRPSPAFRTTMRSPEKPPDRETSPHKKNHNLLGKKHPNKHNEGARKRWREFVTEKERKRYEGLWAANRGLHLTEKMFSLRPDTKGKNLHMDAVAAVVVKDLWGRSRLPLDILEQIWELVDRGPRPKWWLNREEFIMGLWLIDQSLRGRKLPGKVQDGTWESVRKMGVVLKGYDELGLKDKQLKRGKP